MKTIALTIALATGFAVPALAMDDMMDASKMTCSDYMDMDSAGQMKAVEAMKMGGHDAMASGDAMKSDESMKSEDAMKSEDSMSSDDAMAGLTKACDGHPDMMAMDAMKSSM